MNLVSNVHNLAASLPPLVSLAWTRPALPVGMDNARLLLELASPVVFLTSQLMVSVDTLPFDNSDTAC